MYQIKFSNSPKIYHLPENWDEVTAEQLKSLIEIVRTEEDNDLAKLLVIKSWGGLTQSIFKQINQFFISESEDNLVPLIAPFFEFKGFQKNIMQSIEVPGQGKYYGFSDRLENVTAGEYSMAIHHYDLMLAEEEDKSHLINFVATLYRPRRTDGVTPGHTNWNGDFRVAYNEDNIDVYADHIARMDNETLYAIRVCFERIMKWMGDLPNYSLLFNTVNTKKSGFPDFDRVLDSINGDSLSSINQVKALPLHTIFNKLQWLQEEYNANKPITPTNKFQEL